MLLASFGIILVLRFGILALFKFPPSDDGAGDVWIAKCWLTGQTACYDYVPPLYYFVVVIPLLQVFNPFDVVRVIVAVMPTVLIFPAYFASSSFNIAPIYSLLFATMVGMSAELGVMATWNSGFSLFSMIFLLLFLGLLARALDVSNKKNILGAGIAFSLIAGSHHLTLFVTAMFCGFMVILNFRDGKAIKTIFKVIGVGVAFSALYIPFYLNLLASSASSGVVISVPQGGPLSVLLSPTIMVQTLLAGFGQTIFPSASSLALIIDFVFAAVSITVLLAFVRASLRGTETEKAIGSNRQLPKILTAMILVVPVGIVISSSNWERFGYYLVFPYMFLLTIGVTQLIVQMPEKHKKFFVYALVALLLGVNVVYSGAEFALAAGFYSFGCSGCSATYSTDLYDGVQFLSTLHGSHSQVVYAPFLETWVLADTKFGAVIPTSLDGQIVQPYRTYSFYSDMIYFGQYNIGNQYLDIAFGNYPNPDLILENEGGNFWTPVAEVTGLFPTQASIEHVNLSASQTHDNGMSADVEYTVGQTQVREHISLIGSNVTFSSDPSGTMTFTMLAPSLTEGYWFYVDNTTISDTHKTSIAAGNTARFDLLSNGPTGGQYTYAYSSAALARDMNITYYLLDRNLDGWLVDQLNAEGNVTTAYSNANVIILRT